MAAVDDADLAQKLVDRVVGLHTAVTVSVGGASAPHDAETVDGLIAAADRALYEAKRAGKNRAVASSSAAV